MGMEYEEIYDPVEKAMIEMRDMIYLREYYKMNENFVLADE